MDTGGDYSFRAIYAGEMCDIALGVFGGLSPASAINNGVLFRVYCRLFVVIPDDGMVWASWEEPVLSGGDDAVVFH